MRYNTVFWNVDTQYDFMKPDGKLPVNGGEGAEHIEPQLRELTELADRYDVTVVNTADYHTPESEELVFEGEPDLDSTFPPHCMENTEGADYIGATEPEDPAVFDWRGDYDIAGRLEGTDRDIVVYKDRFDVFEGSPHTEDVVNYLDPDRAFVYGVATDVCVDQAVNGLIERGVEVYAVEDAIEGIDPQKSAEAVRSWEEKGAKTIHTEEIPDYLER